MRRPKDFAVLAACVAATLAVSTAAEAAPAGAKRPNSTQRALTEVLAKQPGGVQVSDNAISWDGGQAILVVPSPGELFAPPGLGSGIREETLTTPLLQEQAEATEDAASRRVGETMTAKASADSCPGGIFTTDYYCFYEDRDYGGRRLQFTGNTEAGDAVQWGFNNSISSWVSNDVDCTVKAYDPRMPSDLGNYMWRQVENSQSSYVGNGDNDRLSFWNCH